MPWYRMRQDLGGAIAGVFHLKLDRRIATPPCAICGYIATRQCDRILQPPALVHGKPRRCDRWICSYCTYEPEPDKDLCPGCVQLFKAWLAARTNSTDGEGP